MLLFCYCLTLLYSYLHPCTVQPQSLFVGVEQPVDEDLAPVDDEHPVDDTEVLAPADSQQPVDDTEVLAAVDNEHPFDGQQQVNNEGQAPALFQLKLDDQHQIVECVRVADDVSMPDLTGFTQLVVCGHELGIENDAVTLFVPSEMVCAEQQADNSVPEASELSHNAQSQNHSRKRKRNVDARKKSVCKRLRNSGEAYVSVNGEYHAAKTMGTRCSCRMHCFDKLSTEHCKSLYESFWKMADFDKLPLWANQMFHTKTEKHECC